MTKQNTQKDEAYKLGYDAAIDNQYIEVHNPYPENSSEYNKWHLGYKDGCHEIRCWNGSE